ncbi:DUF4197 domain-containing protein [Alcanivorax quisquiliarum]|uniref:DUF4197 domain-containing protein n=1 Tax=Alcanivorax quisquiliarum TaxID=2933565 RepID=A0ABT0E5G1_9GAMM|nr:DUF4197 domain-containing protein [Alcanivorax quisquiliarum]MCK0536924.1 DUF4197 domain-containing protein [Alcanivorax quisquiliarum]
MLNHIFSTRRPWLARAAVLCAALLAGGCAGLNEYLAAGGGTAGQNGSSSHLATAVRQTLEISSERATTALSQPGGYGDDPLLRLALPSEVNQVTSALRQFGLGQHVDRLEASMNAGAEQAAGEAAEVFLTTIRGMSISDALGIVRGGDTAATSYFREQTEATLRQRYQPIIRSNLEQVGFYDQYRLVVDVYNSLPISGRLNLDLERYVLDRSLDGLFTRMAAEEQQIRRDPLGRGGELINAIFTRQ